MIAKCGLGLLAVLLTGCSRAPSFDLFGSLFPAWLACLAAGAVSAVLARWLISRAGIPLVFPVLVYPSLTMAVTCALWLAFFRL